MDDQRDYEEEQAQEAALREEQEAELDAVGETTDDEIDRGQVDSSSEDYVGPEVAAEVDAEPGTEEPQSLTLAQIVASEGICFAHTWDEIAALCEFGARTAAQMRATYDHGLDPEPDKVVIEMTALESQALSVGLNLVTLFEPRLAEYAESLLRRSAEMVRALPLNDERRAEIRRHLEEMAEEQEASFFGFESVEQYREAREQAEAQLAAAAEASPAQETGAPHLN